MTDAGPKTIEYQEDSGRIVVTIEKPQAEPDIYVLLRPTFGAFRRLEEMTEKLAAEYAEHVDATDAENVDEKDVSALRGIGREWIFGEKGGERQARWWQEIFRLTEKDGKVPDVEDLPLCFVQPSLTLQMEVTMFWMGFPIRALGIFDPRGEAPASVNGAGGA